MQNNSGTFLFSIDLEDVRDNVVNGHTYRDRVAENTSLFLNWLKKYNSHATFFVVGKIAERYPDLIKKIVSDGHEIACHSYCHYTVNTFNSITFGDDLDKNLDALHKAGADDITGFRAPIFSLTEESSSWAYDVLKNKGFTYSSSVLPAKSPLFGWEGFGSKPRKMDNGIIEIPMTVEKIYPLTIPVAGGVYFRVIPKILLYPKIRKVWKRNDPLLSYLHPYDADTQQEKFMHASINNKVLNWLMYYNRKNLFNRLDDVMNMGCKIVTYKEYIRENGFSF
jgi:polysaccharide deacetylase family protein (PEP-CTERM system associated)